MIRHTFVPFFLLLAVHATSQHTLDNPEKIDHDLLNNFILDEVNALRKKAKVDSLRYQPLLSLAADDHAGFMEEKEKITHFQRWNKIKKTPKNRSDFYGAYFEIVGENVQLNNLHLPIKNTPDKKFIGTYEALAKSLVKNWRDSPPHYANMISENHLGTYTSVRITEEGVVYACQLFSGSKYEYPEEVDEDSLPDYKIHNDRKCKRCDRKPPIGVVGVHPDSSIYFTHFPKPFFQLGTTRAVRSLFRDGLAADIVLKSQYPCDSADYFNASRGIRGIPLEPVYLKSFWKGSNSMFLGSSIYLGKVPAWVDEDYEVNLTVVNKKRACISIIYHEIPAYFHLDFDISLKADTLSNIQFVYNKDVVSYRINYQKSDDFATDSLLNPIAEMLKSRGEIDKIVLQGFASIEGSHEMNQALYHRRAGNVLTKLYELGVDTSDVVISTSENFWEFRKDIRGTAHDTLGKYSNEELKELLKDRGLSNDLEYLFKNHRYAKLTVYFSSKDSVIYDKAALVEKLNAYALAKSVKKVQEIQSMLYRLALNGKMDVQELRDVKIPADRKMIDALYNQAVIEFLLDSLNSRRLDSLESKLLSLKELKKSDKKVNTGLAYIAYMKSGVGISRGWRKWFMKFEKQKYVDKEMLARMTISIAARHDWYRFSILGRFNWSKFYYRKMKRYVKKARLDVNETFQLAQYYAFFGDSDYAFKLTHKLIDDTDNADDIVFFLKLIQHLDVNISRKKHLSYFRKVRDLTGDEFCTYFNSPNLNFQVFDDPEIKVIYCEQCAGK